MPKKSNVKPKRKPKKQQPRKVKPVVHPLPGRKADVFDILAQAEDDESSERLATPQELAAARPNDPYAEYGGSVDEWEQYKRVPGGAPYSGTAFVGNAPEDPAAGNEPKDRPKYEKFFAKPFSRRYPLGWWRYFDPYVGLVIFLGLAQRVMEALHLSAAWDFYYARVRLGSNFEKLVVNKAAIELRSSITALLDFYKAKGYSVKPGIADVIMRDLVNAIAADARFKEQARELYTMRPSRKALYYRIWALWDVKAKYLSSIVHDRVTKGGN